MCHMSGAFHKVQGQKEYHLKLRCGIRVIELRLVSSRTGNEGTSCPVSPEVNHQLRLEKKGGTAIAHQEYLRVCQVLQTWQVVEYGSERADVPVRFGRIRGQVPDRSTVMQWRVMCVERQMYGSVGLAYAQRDCVCFSFGGLSA